METAGKWFVIAVLVALGVVGIYWLYWQLWMLVLPQLWMDAPDSLAKPGFGLFVGAVVLVRAINGSLLQGFRK